MSDLGHIHNMHRDLADVENAATEDIYILQSDFEYLPIAKYVPGIGCPVGGTARPSAGLKVC
jgi:hypothetical protein